MAKHFAAFEAFSTRHQAQPLYDGEYSSRFTSALDHTASPMFSDPIPFMSDQRPGAGWVAECSGYIETSNGTRAQLSTIEGLDGWFIDGSYYGNGNILAIRPETTIGIGRQTRQYTLCIAGDALVAALALSGDPDALVVELRYRTDRDFNGYWQGFQSFGTFVDVPPNTIGALGNPSNMQSAINGLLLNQFSKTGNRYNLASGNDAARYVANCSFAAVDCTGFVQIRSSDLGNAVGQIPTNVANNTAAAFNYHPTTFFRSQNDKVSGLASRADDLLPISTTGVGQPIGIYINDAPLESSHWLVGIDGGFQVLKLFHDSSLGNPRTPLEIWEQIWSPLLQGSDSTYRAAQIASNYSLAKLQYLSYARYLDRVGTTYTQTDAEPIG